MPRHEGADPRDSHPVPQVRQSPHGNESANRPVSYTQRLSGSTHDHLRILRLRAEEGAQPMAFDYAEAEEHRVRTREFCKEWTFLALRVGITQSKRSTPV